MGSPSKKLNPQVYPILSDALTNLYWYKKDLKRYLEASLAGAPGILVGIDFDGYKQHTVQAVVDRLMRDEGKYQDVILKIMMDLSQTTDFSHLQRISEDAQREKQIIAAKISVTQLQKWVSTYRSLIEEQEQHSADFSKKAADAKTIRDFSSNLAVLKQKFYDLAGASDPQKRGREFETFLNELFGLFGLDPRAAYILQLEQIDGAFSFDTDDYVLEAKWHSKPIGRGELDIFKSKVDRKGKNALGLFVSISGYTSDAIAQYSASTPFIVMDYEDILMILEERVRLDVLLRKKKRYANETGHCFLRARDII